MSQIGKIERVHLREVWKHEAHDFTQWLEENLDVINGVTDLNLISAEREKAAGKFSVDLVAEDSCGITVVIENQLERSDHDHLGKILTYLAAFNAKAAVWVLPEARPEHVAAIAWLNESTSAKFYVIKAEAIRIVTDSGEKSAAAPLMTLILGPSLEASGVAETKKELEHQNDERYQFWVQLYTRLAGRTSLHTSLKPTTNNWISLVYLRPYLGLNYVIEKKKTRAELYIDRYTSAEDNQQIFDHFYANKDAIEEAFGAPLSWESLEGRRACRIAIRLGGGGYSSPKDQWPAIQDNLIDSMIRLEQALRPFAESLP